MENTVQLRFAGRTFIYGRDRGFLSDGQDETELSPTLKRYLDLLIDQAPKGRGLVTRETIDKTLWPTETFTKVDQRVHNLNSELRKLLGDGCIKPARAAGGFIFHVEIVGPSIAEEVPLASTSTPLSTFAFTKPRIQRHHKILLTMGLGLVFVFFASSAYVSHVRNVVNAAPVVLRLMDEPPTGSGLDLSSAFVPVKLARQIRIERHVAAQSHVYVLSIDGHGKAAFFTSEDMGARTRDAQGRETWGWTVNEGPPVLTLLLIQSDTQLLSSRSATLCHQISQLGSPGSLPPDRQLYWDNNRFEVRPKQKSQLQERTPDKIRDSPIEAWAKQLSRRLQDCDGIHAYGLTFPVVE